jgi:hypothetical protein
VKGFYERLSRVRHDRNGQGGMSRLDAGAGSLLHWGKLWGLSEGFALVLARALRL